MLKSQCDFSCSISQGVTCCNLERRRILLMQGVNLFPLVPTINVNHFLYDTKRLVSVTWPNVFCVRS